MNQVKSVGPGVDLVTDGLSTCYALLAVGTPHPTKNINRVMAHISAVQKDVLFTTWSDAVRAAEMTDVVVYVSQPDDTMNENMSDERIREMILDDGLQVNDATMKTYRDNTQASQNILIGMTAESRSAAQRCEPVNWHWETRDNARLTSSDPYGTLKSYADGTVMAEGRRLDPASQA